MDITLLSVKEIKTVKEIDIDTWTQTEPLEVITKYGAESLPTDLAILTFGYVSESNMTNYSNTGMYYWTKDKNEEKEAIYVVDGNDTSFDPFFSYDIKPGIRPVLVPSEDEFKLIIEDEERLTDNIYTVQYGEYPQWAPDDNMQKKLEELYTLNKLAKTGKNYTFNDKDYQFNGFHPEQYEEYEYDGKKYIRIEARPLYRACHLRNGKKYKSSETVWVEVSPITWLIDYETNRLISLNCLLAGMEFNENINFDSFEKTDMYYYLKKYMLKDMSLKTKKTVTKINLSSEELSSYEEKIFEDETLSKEELEMLQGAFENLKESNPKKR